MIHDLGGEPMDRIRDVIFLVFETEMIIDRRVPSRYF